MKNPRQPEAPGILYQNNGLEKEMPLPGFYSGCFFSITGRPFFFEHSIVPRSNRYRVHMEQTGAIGLDLWVKRDFGQERRLQEKYPEY
ncbi:MAG: hypothetical protein QNK37_05270 [Acidobacteriota bacterium]|nr:hypothetical protein [Acidobacteriota bacterium]